eukprot:TRINITY_DN5989_c0_g1_i3.p2 TRINITY_DN5989_c0_g1~~TRINITY_DN5989_c0_g1_i3.p2  ORF type:complete len:108 (+),score=14.95 TRINITY_DN5989_c0_g1_i3:13-336(+)
MGKDTQEGLNATLGIVMRSGQVTLGFKSTLKAIRKGQAKLILISNNLPTVRKSQLEYLAMLGNVKNIPYGGNNTELGSACGKFFRVSCMAITDAGDSDILEKSKDGK